MKDDENKKWQDSDPRQEGERKDEPIRVVNAEELSRLPEIDKDKRKKNKGMIWETGSDGGSAGDGGAA